MGRLFALSALSASPIRGLVQERLPTRPIPATGEMLPVIGFGSSKAVRLIPEEGVESLAAVLRMLVSYGGRVVDTTPYPESNERQFGQLLQSPDLRDELFITMKINTMDEEVGVQQVRQAQRLFGRPTLDVLQVMSLRGLHAHWPNLRNWKDAGEVRYIGVTVSNYEDYGALESFITSESVDFLQVNYSVVETLAEDRILPLAQDLGVAVIVNGPFMNGDYFGLVSDQELPGWAAEFDCASWAQFSLKYILAHPGVNCVLTETTNPQHMLENIESAFGRMPGESERRRMRELALAL
ncbi:MAG TPA: aldo/keto reductase [Gammaproteobacteria bacterium]